MKKKRDKRPLIQLAAALATNIHLPNFLTGKIYMGKLKTACVPGLNCYSCPGATGACPIGGLQAVLGGRKHSFSFYVFGLLMAFGMLLGRAICGFLCLFGFVQDLLYRVPTPKLTIPSKADRLLRYLKYAVLLVLVILLPIFATNAFGVAPPYFCKWVCPAGALEGGIPLVSLNPSLQTAVGALFTWKMGVLAAIVLASVFLYRPFCKYLCPLGAFYALFNQISLTRMTVEKDRCVQCGACQRACKMGVHVLGNINSAECIRCGACKRACPINAIHTRFGFRDAPEKRPAQENASAI